MTPWKGNACDSALEGSKLCFQYGYQLSPCGPCPAAADSGQTLWPSEVRAEKLGRLKKEEIGD